MSNHSDDYTDQGFCCESEDGHVPICSVLAALPSADRVSEITSIFGALSDSTRFRILAALAQRELCVCDLAEICGISQSGVSHQLRLLRDRRLVTFRRHGKRALYSLGDEHVRALIAMAVEHAEERFER